MLSNIKNDQNCNIFIEYSDPIGGVSTWALNIQQILSQYMTSHIIGMCSEENRKEYAITFASEKRFSHILSMEEVLQTFNPNAKQISDWNDLSPTAKLVTKKTSIFIPNYFEIAFRLSALSRIQGYHSRCIGICHTDEEEYYYLLTKYEKIINQFIGVSSKCVDELKNRLPHRYEDIIQWTYGVEIPSIYRKRKEGDPLQLLFVGRLQQRQKRILDFHEIITQLESQSINYTMTFIGTGTELDALKKALAPYQDKVTFMGPLPPDKTRDLYINYDCLIMTSETEGTSIAMLEAMAFGLVPIVTSVSGATDVIMPNHNGFLYSVGEIQQVIKFINILYKDINLWETLSFNARETINKNFNLINKARAFALECMRVSLLPMVSPENARIALNNSLSMSKIT